MNTKKATKRALLTSVMALVMCVVMLVGTTFAWFTDTASTGLNKITSGNLHVEIQNKEGTKIENLEWVAKDGRAQDEILWEPGATYTLTPFKIANTGKLALKYKMVVTGLDGDADLLRVIKFTYKLGDTVLDLNEEGHLVAGAATGMITVSATMDKNAGNEYMDKTLEGVEIKVYATQDTVENDSFNNQYDKDATYLTYPAGVTKVSFPESVQYSTWTGTSAMAPATAAYVDNTGAVTYVADVTDAIEAGATTVYLKEDATVNLNMSSQTNRTPDLTSDLTIYANGADFEYGELAINTTDAGKSGSFTIKVYDAKNLRVWGNTPNAGATQNVILENCTFEGKGINSGNSIASGGIFFAYGETGTINLTMNNCKVSGSDQGVYFGCDGSLTVKDSSFTECATGIKVSYKGTGTRTDRIENCVFTKCGCTTEMAGGTTYLVDDSAAIKYKKSGTGTITLTLKSNTITETLGEKGDTQFIGVTPVNG